MLGLTGVDPGQVALLVDNVPDLLPAGSMPGREAVMAEPSSRPEPELRKADGSRRGGRGVGPAVISDWSVTASRVVGPITLTCAGW